MVKLCKKLSLSIGLLFMVMPIKLQAQSCPNLDFSQADFTNWQAYKGTWGSTVNIHTSAPDPNRHAIMNAQQLIAAKKINDEKCPLIKKVPTGFAYSAKLGNSNVDAEMEALEYTLTIDSTNALLILHFAWVMEDPNHDEEDQPQFSMRIKDSSGNPMNFPCGNVNFVSSQKLTNLACKAPQYSSLVARDWTTVGFNLSSLMGQTIKIYFETRDCKLSAHYGYAYLVGECQPFEINLVFCDGEKNATLTAPKGFVNYIWTRSSQPSSVWKMEGADKQQITINNATEGEVFTCMVISELDNCSATLSTLVTKTYVNANIALNAYNPCTRTAAFADSTFVINGKKASISWEIPSLNMFSTDSLFTYTFPDSTQTIDYLVRLTAFTENGCEGSTEQIISVNPLPQVDISGISQICAGDSSYLKAIPIQSQFVNHQWSWTDENGNQTKTGDSLKIYGPGTYKVVSTNTDNCVAADSIDVSLFPIPHIELVNKVIESCGGKNGSIQVRVNNAATPVSFLWNTGATTSKLDSLAAGTYQIRISDGNGCKADTTIVVDLYPMPALAVTKTDETCGNKNGTITLTVNSEKPNTVKYSWGGRTDTTSTLTGLQAGTYFVSVQDTLCILNDSIEIEQVDIPVAGFVTNFYDTCTHTAVFADLSSVINGSKDSILWEIPQLNIISTDSLFTHTFPDPEQVVNYLVRLTVFAGSGCVDTFTQYISMYPSPKIKIDGSDLLCAGDSSYLQTTVLKSQIVDYEWSGGEVNGNFQTATESTLKIYTEGTYILTVTNTENCKASDTITVTSPPKIYIDVTDTRRESCGLSNGYVEINARNAVEPVHYAWFPSRAGDTVNRLEMIAAGIYKVNVMDSNGCKADTTLEIKNISVLPFAKLDFYDTCTHTAAFADLSSVANGSKDSILWEIPTLGVTSADSLFTYTFSEPTGNQPDTYLVRLIVFAEYGCTDTFHLSPITIYPLPQLKIVQTTPLCAGDSSYLETMVLKSQIVDYEWSGGEVNGNFQTTTESTLKIYTEGTYILTVTNTENCKASDTITVNIASVPHIEVINNHWETCNGGNGFIEVSPKNAAYPVKFAWNTGNAQDTTNQLNLLKSGTYQVTMTDGNGCKTDTNIVVDLYPALTVFVSESPESCKGANGLITLSVNSAKPSSVKYIWNGLPYTTPSLSGLKMGTYRVTIQDTLCTLDTTILIKTTDGLVADFEIQSYDTCSRTATFADLSFVENGTIASIEWEIPKLSVKSSNALFTYTFPDPPTDQSIEYSVRLTVTTENNCVKMAELPIRVYPSPKVKIDGENLVCVGDSTYLIAVPLKSKFVEHIWKWQNEQNEMQTAVGDSLKIYGKGVYYLTSSNTENCPTSDLTTVFEAPVPHIDITSTNWETCEKKNGSIQISPQNVVEPVKFMWNTGRTQDTTDRIVQLSSGKYDVKIIDGNGCKADASITVDAYPLPFIAGVEIVTEKCHREDGEIHLTVHSASPTSLTYQWEGFNNTTASLTHIKSGTYKVSIQDSLCTIDTIISIGHVDGPTADFELSSYNVAINNPFTVTDMSSGSVNTWNWNMGDGNTKTGKEVIHSYIESGNYKIYLEIVDENGCMDTASKMIHIFKLEVYIPNMFTPNGDGLNDIWKPVLTEYAKEGYKLSIFDRWGQIVFFTTDPEAGWDGNINGNPAAPNSVFSYNLTVRDYMGLEYDFSGHVTLIR